MPDEPLQMPQIPFGSHRISRLIVGANQQMGVSHQSREMTMHMLEYFTADRIVSYLQSCLAQGIDTWQANYFPNGREALLKLREEGGDINLIPNSAPQFLDPSEGRLHAILERVENAFPEMLEEYKPIGVYLWGSMTDRMWREGKIDTARDFLAKVRDAGVQAGIGTHIPEVIEHIEEKGWDVDFYMASLYRAEKTREEILEVLPEVPHDGADGREIYLPSELPRMCDVISKTSKTCLAFKLFAGGRTSGTPEKVREAFEYVFEHIKPTDAVVVGMYPRFADQIKENADLVKKYGAV